jgi:hypothetical protein
MTYRFSAGMAEVTRLTREGRVADATALIQALLRPHDSMEAPTPKREPRRFPHP